MNSKGSSRVVYFRKKNKAQSTLEYALIIIVAVAGLLAMQVYLKRGLQGRLRTQADELGEQYAPKQTKGTATLSYRTKTQSIGETLSETQLTERYGKPIDLDGDGKIENDVFGTETTSKFLPGSGSDQTGWEEAGPLESSLQ